jgi:hypothetical protein
MFALVLGRVAECEVEGEAMLSLATCSPADAACLRSDDCVEVLRECRGLVCEDGTGGVESGGEAIDEDVDRVLVRCNLSTDAERLSR